LIRKRLGDLLVESGLITEDQLTTVLQKKSRDELLGDALLQQGIITEQQLLEVLEIQLGIPQVQLFHYPFDAKIFSLIPKDLAKRSLIVPLKIDGDKLYVAMKDPMDFITIDDLRLITGFQIIPAIASKEDILKTINKYYEDESFDDFLVDQAVSAEKQEELLDVDAPVVRIVNQIMSAAVTQKASDIHFDPQETRLLVRFRIDGVLHDERTLPKLMQGMVTARIKIMAKLDITEHRIPQDGRIKTNVDFRPIDLRVSTLPTVYGEKIVMRILD
jgi:type IV pilus assembly protein PilB